MDKNNATKILEEALSRSLGLPHYIEIMAGNPDKSEFQRMFNGYYKVRRNENWQKEYYAIFTEAKKNPENYTFERILRKLYEKTGMIEASFSSKMLATIDPSKPIWDQYVLKNLGLQLKGLGEERLEKAVELYSEIESWYNSYLNSSEDKENIRVFDLMLPDYALISNIKKIDCLLWLIGCKLSR